MGGPEDLGELSRETTKKVRRLASDLGLDGSPHASFEDLVPGRRKKGKSGKKRGTKNLTFRERLRRRGYDV